MVFMPNITTNHAITYTNLFTPGNFAKKQVLQKLVELFSVHCLPIKGLN